jgi:hypothetical protein
MKRVCLIALVAIAGIWGCVPSIHGIATKENTVWDDGLLGRWGDPNKVDDPNAEVWQFEKGSEDGRYLFTHSEKGLAGEFDVYLVQLSDMLFLDIFPAEGTCEKMNSMSQMHLMPVHTFMKVDGIGEELRLRFMDPDAIKNLVKEQPDLIKHETRGEDGDGVVLTAGPGELQNFLTTYADKIFGDKESSGLKRL